MDDFVYNHGKKTFTPIEIVETDEKKQYYYQGVSESKLLLEMDLKSKLTFMYPTNTIEGSINFLQPKYGDLVFVFEGYDINIDEHLFNDELVVEGLPVGFTKTLKFGLGLEKKYKTIVDTLCKYLKGVKKLVLSMDSPTRISKSKFIINDSDFDKIRRGINRNDVFYQKESMGAKELFVYDNLLHELEPSVYPELKTKPSKNVIYKILKNTDFRKLSNEDKQSLSVLKENTDLSFFTVMLEEFESKLQTVHQEREYQKFFENNPLLLTMIAGTPYVQFKNQAYVGGKSFDNFHGQYPDFLLKHKMTNNAFIVEIKTPQTALLDKKKYRATGVYSVSKELSGAISQLLTQKYQLETDISTLIKNSADRDMEAYNVQGLIVIGQLSSLDEKEMKRSFELFRHNQKNLRIITYDECLVQLKAFVNFLSNSENVKA